MFGTSVKSLLSRPLVDGRDNFVFVKTDQSLQSSSKYTDVFYAGEKSPDDIALKQFSEWNINKRLQDLCLHQDFTSTAESLLLLSTS